MQFKPLSVLVGAAAAVTLSLFTAVAHAAWPDRPITLIVPWGAGGGTDATARIIGQPAREGTRPAGHGREPHRRQRRGRPLGHRRGGTRTATPSALATVEIGMMHWQGLTELTGASYTPIGLVNADPAGVQVRADSPYKTVNDLLAAIKANPGQAQGLGHRPGRHLAPGDRRPAA